MTTHHSLQTAHKATMRASRCEEDIKVEKHAFLQDRLLGLVLPKVEAARQGQRICALGICVCTRACTHSMCTHVSVDNDDQSAYVCDMLRGPGSSLCGMCVRESVCVWRYKADHVSVAEPLPASDIVMLLAIPRALQSPSSTL